MYLPETLKKLTKLEKEIFDLRLAQHLPEATYALQQLYGRRPDFDDWVQRFIGQLATAYAQRPADLRLLDLQHTHQADWFQRPEAIGYICYVDKFAGNLKGVAEKIPYLKELGVTYLHLMPLLQPRPRPNDGGYAVQDYGRVDERLGTMADLAELGRALRQNGISLCTDIVCNHTAEEHEWAMKAKAGDPTYQEYYFLFPDRTLPDQYGRTLRHIFPETAPGNFTHHPEIPVNGQPGAWVWTTFNNYQWDLNYGNPAVFGEMLNIILKLANQGIEVFRMDAVAFMWKQMGTNCENLPEAHAILQAFRALTQIACPGIIFKAEAIVSPQDVVPYFGTWRMAGQECELAYHNSLMVLLWSMLAEKDVVLATHSLEKMPITPPNVAWVNYVRCHDDIGWAITDENATAVGLNGFSHRSFLGEFYAGKYPTSWSRGAEFQVNPETMDRRISGAGASLAGLEAAVANNDSHQIDLAIKRFLLIHSVIFMSGGIPLLYMGDEIGLMNDYSYVEDPLRANDNRWMHRPQMDWETAAQRHDPSTIAGRLFAGMQKLVASRHERHELHAEAATAAIWTHNDKLFGLLRHSPRGRLLLLGNFSNHPQTITGQRMTELQFGGSIRDVLTGREMVGRQNITLEPYESMWIVGF